MGSNVVALSNFVVMGTLTIPDGNFVDAANSVVSIGVAYADPGNGLALLQLDVIGNLSTLPTQLTADVFVNATWNLPNSVDVTGSVTTNAILSIDGFDLGVSQNFTVQNGGQLRMGTVGSIVDVEGRRAVRRSGRRRLVDAG